MTSPWNNIDKAYMPMFDERVIIRGRRNGVEFDQTIACAIFTSNTGDPLAEESPETDREDISLTIRREDYAFVRKLRIGDTIERTEYNGLKYKITSVKNDDLMGMVILARSI